MLKKAMYFFFFIDTQKSPKLALRTWARNRGLLPNPTAFRRQETLAHSLSNLRVIEPQTTWKQTMGLTIPTKPLLK